MATTVVAVLHGRKAERIIGPNELRANPPLTPEGALAIHGLVPGVEAFGPFSAIYSSRLSRALGTASVFAMAYGLDIQTMELLGQPANKDGDEVIPYPGHEGEDLPDWKENGIRALRSIGTRHVSEKILVVSHRPVIGDIIAHTRGISDAVGLETVVNNHMLAPRGFVIFSVDGDNIELVIR